jgi:hypothetical protein
LFVYLTGELGIWVFALFMDYPIKSDNDNYNMEGWKSCPMFWADTRVCLYDIKGRTHRFAPTSFLPIVTGPSIEGSGELIF